MPGNFPMYPRRLLVVIGVIAFAVALLLHAPAKRVLGLLPGAERGWITGTSGTLLHGLTTIRGERGDLRVAWDLQPWRLLLLGLGAEFRVSGQDLSLQGRVALHPWGYRYTVDRGEVGSPRLNGLLAPSGASIDQALALHDVSLAVSPGGTVRDAGGVLAWGPGSVRLRNRAAPVVLPALRGTLAAIDGRLQLVADGETAPGQPLATLEIDPAANQLHLRVLKRGARVAGLAAEAAGAPDTPFVELRQPLR